MMAAMSEIDDKRWADRRRLGPVGLWRGASGSFASVASDLVWFGPDGEGWVRSHSPLFGEQRVGFRWRPYDIAVIEILPTAWPDDGEPADDEPPEWQRVRWEAVEQADDAGRGTVMREVGQAGFWILPDPLAWEGDRPPA